LSSSKSSRLFTSPLAIASFNGLASGWAMMNPQVISLKAGVFSCATLHLLAQHHNLYLLQLQSLSVFLASLELLLLRQSSWHIAILLVYIHSMKIDELFYKKELNKINKSRFFAYITF
jgi:hypothetical protein